jgi:hypothetical protein
VHGALLVDSAHGAARGQPPKSRLSRQLRSLSASDVAFVIGVLMIFGLTLLLLVKVAGGDDLNVWVGGVAFAVPLLLAAAASYRQNALAKADEAQARQRVRQAEDKLGDAIRGSVPIDGVIHGDVYINASRRVITDPERPLGEANEGEETFVDEQVSVDPKDDRLTLAALWGLTHTRMDEYHVIATGQAKRSFGAAQIAMGIGFVLLVVFAILAVEAKTAAAIGAGGLGAVGAAFSAYIGKTFIRSQESAADHLRAYFDQPLELSRYLAAERLLADAQGQGTSKLPRGRRSCR